MPYRVEIKKFLLDQGLNVREVAGWETRGNPSFNPKGSVNHHTAGPPSGIHPSLNTLIFGRHDLVGPLCNVSLSRDNVVYLIAAGRANHAGSGSWRGLIGNSSVWGLEVEHTGVIKTEPEPTEEKWDIMAKIHAAFALCSGFPAANVCQHFEWTSRKIDFVNARPAEFRSRVQNYISNPGGGNVVNSVMRPGYRGPDVEKLQGILYFWWSQGLGEGLKLHPGIQNGVYHPQTAEAARQLKIIISGGKASPTIDPASPNWGSNTWIEYGKFLEKLSAFV